MGEEASKQLVPQRKPLQDHHSLDTLWDCREPRLVRSDAKADQKRFFAEGTQKQNKVPTQGSAGWLQLNIKLQIYAARRRISLEVESNIVWSQW